MSDPRGVLPFVLGAALGAAATAAVLFYRYPPTREAPTSEPVTAPADPLKTISLFDWTGTGKLGDLLVCTCEPGRVAPAPTPKKRKETTP